MDVKLTQWWSSDVFPPDIFEGLPSNLKVSSAGLLIVEVKPDGMKHAVVQEFDYLDYVYTVCGVRFMLPSIASVKPLTAFEDLDGFYCRVCGVESEYKFMVSM